VAELVPLLGGSGVFGVLALVIAWLLKSNRDDRSQAEEQIKAANARAKEARAEAAELEDLIDAEQARRRKAEEERADLALEVKGLRVDIGKLGAEVEQLRKSMT
jgi:septal ring factor EnvC (AmiA/AmiB activator)